MQEFRAWDLQKKKMKYNPLIPDTSFLNDAFEDKRFIIMQSFGFKDNKNQKFFENDIVECTIISKNRNVPITKIYFILSLNFKEGIPPFLDYYFHESNENDYVFKILGNDYENPNLIKELYDNNF